MTYRQALFILERAKIAQESLPMLIKQMSEAAEAHQHLTATYGRERVSSTIGEYTCAGQRALEYADERRAEVEKRLTRVLDCISNARKLLRLIINNDDAWHILDMHYISGWSYGKIAKEYKTSISTVKRWRENALQALRGALDNQTKENP